MVNLCFLQIGLMYKIEYGAQNLLKASRKIQNSGKEKFKMQALFKHGVFRMLVSLFLRLLPAIFCNSDKEEPCLPAR